MTGELPAVTIKKVIGGRLSTHLVETLKNGDELLITDPSGRFGLQKTERNEHLVFIGGGSGITPLFSMIKTALLAVADVTVTLLYGNRDKESIIFLEQLTQLQHQYKSRLRVVHFLENLIPDNHLTSAKGYVSRDFIETIIAAPHPPTGFYLCGPDAMMESITGHLNELHVNPSVIYRESFSSGIKDTEHKQAIGHSSIRIHRGGETHLLDVAKGQFILQSALNAGLRLPHSCREAMCGSCKVKLIAGKVEMTENYALTDTQLGEGYVLLCSGRPVSDEVVLSYP